jgi:hypothetical protein
MSCKGPRRPAKAGGAVQEWWAAHARWLEYTARSRSSSTSSIFGRRKRSHPVLRPNGVSQLAAIAKSVQAPGNVSRLRRVPPPLPPSPQFSDRDQGDRYSRSSTRHRCVKWQSSATHHCKGGGVLSGSYTRLVPRVQQNIKPGWRRLRRRGHQLFTSPQGGSSPLHCRGNRRRRWPPPSLSPRGRRPRQRRQRQTVAPALDVSGQASRRNPAAGPCNRYKQRKQPGVEANRGSGSSRFGARCGPPTEASPFPSADFTRIRAMSRGVSACVRW